MQVTGNHALACIKVWMDWVRMRAPTAVVEAIMKKSIE